MSLHTEPNHGLLPTIPTSSARLRATSATHERGHNRINSLPRNYFQLSAPVINASSSSEDSHPWSWPIIHIVSTRFMQEQGTLVNLARSRLKLFEVVCLPSLMGQTIFDHSTLSEVYAWTKWESEVDDLHRTNETVMDPQLLWIIKVDPNIDKTVLKELNAVLEPVRNFTLVVGSNANFGIGKKSGGWRDGQAGQDILDAHREGHLYFPRDDGGALNMLQRAHDAREDRLVMETRLDADDAINLDYIAALQQTAVRKLIDPNVSKFDASQADDDGEDEIEDESEDEQTQTARWLYWCPQIHAQWNPSYSSEGSSNYPGMLQVFTMPNTCVTAGLTLGFAIGTKEENVPRYEHAKVMWEIAINHNNKGKKNITRGNNAESETVNKHDCGLYPSSKCAVFVENPKVSAFRTRAMTSAGMHNIEAQGETSTKTPAKYKKMAEQLWHGQIEQQFGIQTVRAQEAADFMHTIYVDTVRDNLRGQCTSGHSCKLSSLEKLQRTIDILEEETGGVEMDGQEKKD